MEPTTLRHWFATNLRRLRHAKRISQEELAFKAEMNRTYVNRLEKGFTYPGLKIIVKLANVLEVEPTELLKPPPRQARGKPRS